MRLAGAVAPLRPWARGGAKWAKSVILGSLGQPELVNETRSMALFDLEFTCAGWPSEPRMADFTPSPTQGRSGATAPAANRTRESNTPNDIILSCWLQKTGVFSLFARIPLWSLLRWRAGLPAPESVYTLGQRQLQNSTSSSQIDVCCLKSTAIIRFLTTTAKFNVKRHINRSQLQNP